MRIEKWKNLSEVHKYISYGLYTRRLICSKAGISDRSFFYYKKILRKMGAEIITDPGTKIVSYKNNFILTVKATAWWLTEDNYGEEDILNSDTKWN